MTRDIPKNHELFPESEHNIDVSLDILPPFFRKHRHSFLEIYAVISGEGREIINGREYKLSRGVVTFLQNWHVHELYSSESNPIHLIRCNFGMELVMEGSGINIGLMEAIYSQQHAEPSILLNLEDAENIIHLFENLLSEYRAHEPMKEIILKARIIEILVLFNRARRKLPNEYNENALLYGKINSSYLLTYIHRNWNQNLDYSDILDKFGMSKEELNTFCLENTGNNFPDYLCEVRIRNCCVMLTSFDISIEEVSAWSGFNSYATFFRTFKKVKGITPTEYRISFCSDREKKDIGLHNFPSGLMWKIYHYIQIHYNEDINLECVAKEFHFSKSSISEICTREAGQSFNDILNECRVYHACSYLSSTEIAAVEIGFLVGFNSTETFFRAFKKFRKTSPNEYRKQSSSD